jgi:hypothetical protein
VKLPESKWPLMSRLCVNPPACRKPLAGLHVGFLDNLGCTERFCGCPNGLIGQVPLGFGSPRSIIPFRRFVRHVRPVYEMLKKKSANQCLRRRKVSGVKSIGLVRSALIGFCTDALPNNVLNEVASAASPGYGQTINAY